MKSKENKTNDKDCELYINLTDNQEVALDALDHALDKCIDANVSYYDAKDTVNVWLARIKRQELLRHSRQSPRVERKRNNFRGW